MNEGSKRKFSRNEGQKPKLIKNIITESNNHEFDREVNLSVCLEHTLNHKPQTSSKRFIQKKRFNQLTACVQSVFFMCILLTEIRHPSTQTTTMELKLVD